MHETPLRFTLIHNKLMVEIYSKKTEIPWGDMI